MLRLGTKHRIVGVLGPGVTIVAHCVAECRTIVVIPVAAVQHDIDAVGLDYQRIDLILHFLLLIHDDARLLANGPFRGDEIPIWL